MKFEWDLKKEALNIKKHKIAFSEAASVRIMSARKATKSERNKYEEKNK